MKKILFNDRYGLTQAVLEGRKTQTRRIIVEDVGIREDGCAWFKDELGEYHIVPPTYLIGEDVAVAQSYFDCGYSTRPRYSNDDIQYSDRSVQIGALWTSRSCMGKSLPRYVLSDQKDIL